ncbi:acetyl/propionyl/methylcrotonyl-CoA carboxylase subunit alpha [Bordetella bronchialis]|uniref:3-methylcrotonyl-CoA carboxylase n=1 Tax=Bordetella bronchialis TaxID=463025 RepID=A0A193FBV3_9BORD|nr:acetyl/propionyl/methylcrotonyl-CoA carboxylase subunit alpha [Bordetella bronchialis]ANN64995.1 3-methylcrotonyl-CoA carboxylase [Bordetella bronchialis]ANN70026.1 3-methylcrotonyl-CoA carboxylase [Bordetella bronchialis]
MFSTLLIANRGEIACRVAATARRLGIRTVAVYSDADAQSAHVAACDAAVRLGPAEPRASYLRGDLILAAARATGAQAIHPGYGFLSENPGFAESVTDAGLVFVGPPASAIAAMGSKSAAKQLMEKAGVPLVPGYHGDNQDADFLRRQADEIGYPVLIKASAGGGGKGMRIVHGSADFADALASCRREAASSFGDDRVLIERYLQKPRHIEIQVFADSQGHCIYLFERDCSVQRRHQKVIEEAPAPGMTEGRRQAMGEAAVAAARAVGYVGAGTVEFIAEPDGRFYFMEMNTRLQVEHPVTEMITGLDLVEWQLRVAAGEPLPARQQDLRLRGHAIEARIYAENPDTGFLPSIGTVRYLELPPHIAFANGAVRVDGGVRAGDAITPHYDPMIAKLIVRGDDRDAARARMAQALAQVRVAGLHTNTAFLGRLMRDESFAAADLDTGLIERRRDTLLPPAAGASPAMLALATAALLAREGLPGTRHLDPPPADPWDARDGWRLDGRYQRVIPWLDGDTRRTVALAREADGYRLAVDQDAAVPLRWDASPAGQGGTQAWETRIVMGDREIRGTVAWSGDAADVFHDGAACQLLLDDPLAHAGEAHGEHGGDMTAPMPGKIISIDVRAGDTVSKGQPLLVMEAMKMEHTIAAAADGEVVEVFYAVGDQVPEGAALIALK